jgi:very-short-patch-repair endonuclease
MLEPPERERSSVESVREEWERLNSGELTPIRFRRQVSIDASPFADTVPRYDLIILATSRG